MGLILACEGRGPSSFSAAPCCEMRAAKISNDHFAICTSQEVFWLQVSMSNVFSMKIVQPLQKKKEVYS